MMLRVLSVVCALAALESAAFSQSVPSFNWTKEVGPTGTSSIAGAGTDAAGNVYVAGTTSSPQFPVKSAVQGQMGSSGLYRIIGSGTTGSGYTALGLSSVAAIAVDPQNPATIFVVSGGTLLRSTDSGANFSATTLPGKNAESVALQPGNDQIIFAPTFDQGLLKSADGGATWTAINNGFTPERNSNGQVTVQSVAIDPANVQVMFASTPNGTMRSGDGGASWQAAPYNLSNITFDSFHSNVVYAKSSVPGLDILRSTDSGVTFLGFTVPTVFQEVFPDPIQAGRLIGVGNAALYQSTDGGSTWSQAATIALGYDLVADTANGVYYAAQSGGSPAVVRISDDLQTVTSLGPPASGVDALAVANGVVYAGNSGSSDVFVMKLDGSGNILYSTFFGGSGGDSATAIAVDEAGNVFVTGTTGSKDFPVSKGAYASSGTMFVFRLNGDGSLGYSTYFSGTTPVAIATDGSGSAWVAGRTEGAGLPTTPLALSTAFCCTQIIGIGPSPYWVESTLTRFDAAGSSLVFSTYVPGSSIDSIFGSENPVAALAIAPDGSAYVGGPAGIFRVDAAGDSLIASVSLAASSTTGTQMLSPTAIALGPDGSVYAAGTPNVNFQTTAGAFQMASIASQPLGIMRLDAKLTSVLDSTYFNGSFNNIQVKTMTTDAAGNVYFGGSTPGDWLPTRTPFAGGFASSTGFLSELSGDLSTLQFSSYFGDTTAFAVSSVSVAPGGAVVIGGVTGAGISGGGPVNLWLNSLTLAPPPALRIDTVANAASVLATPLAAGETIEVKGAGFNSGTVLTIGGETVPTISISPTAMFATVPADLSSAPVLVQVQNGGLLSNAVIMPTAIVSPGIFTQDGSGAGLAYILNGDGSLNTPANPAHQGDRVTIYATGVGPVSFTNGYAVTEFPANVYIKNVFCAGVAALMGPISGFPGNVYRITVYVPQFPVLYPRSDVVMKVDGVSSEASVYLSLAQ